MRRLHCVVRDDQDGIRVDTLLRRTMGLSASAVRRAKLLPDGILLDGALVFTNARAAKGQTLSVAVGDAAGNPAVAAVPGPLTIGNEDEDFLVVHKPGGMPVHPSPGHYRDTLANRIMAHYEAIGLTAAFHPVNRLDRGTSGLMAVAKHAHAHERLQAQIQNGTLRRTYLAVCEGTPDPLEDWIEAPIARVPGEVLRRQVDPSGAFARTHYRVLKRGGGRSLVQLELDTGRTHQIRVHMSFLGCPLVGDFLYGTECGGPMAGRFALHSAAIRLRQPVTDAPIALEAPLPDSLTALLGEDIETMR